MSDKSHNRLSTLTVRLYNQEDCDAIRYVMTEADIAWASQAVIFACKAYRTYNEREKNGMQDFKQRMGVRVREQNRINRRIIDELKRENEMLKKKLMRIQSILDDKLQSEPNSPQT